MVTIIIWSILIGIFLLYMWSIFHSSSKGAVGFIANLVIYLPKLLLKIAISGIVLYAVLSGIVQCIF